MREDSENTLILNFFEDNQILLKKNFPGINIEIFKRFYEEYLVSKNLNLITESIEEVFQKCLDGIPFAYILKQKFFYKHEFFMQEGVFIPRSETEILVEECSSFLNHNKKDININILEVGCGSGAVINSVLLDINNNVNAHAIDINSKALELTKKNFLRYFNDSKRCSIKTYSSDRFKSVDSEIKFDLIICNPPYIKRNSDIGGVHEMVLKYEPHEALFLNDEEYEEWFDKLILDSKLYLKENSLFIIEGHENHLENQLIRYKNSGFKSLKLLNDYTHRPRFLKLLT